MRTSFIKKVSVVLLLLGMACGVAGWASWIFWHHMFDVAGVDRVFWTLSVDMQVLEKPVNLLMYVMPAGFLSAGLGLLGASVLGFVLHIMGCLIDSLCALWQATRPVRGQSKE